jgi:hypothetical protein
MRQLCSSIGPNALVHSIGLPRANWRAGHQRSVHHVRGHGDTAIVGLNSDGSVDTSFAIGSGTSSNLLRTIAVQATAMC